MTHKRQDYETVYNQMYNETLQDLHDPIVHTWSNWELMVRINFLLKHWDCIPYSQDELFHISESME